MTNNEKIPEGKVRVSSGEIIDRVNVCFRLLQLPNSNNLYSSSDGTIYIKGKDGTLRRYPPKEKISKKERRKIRAAKNETNQNH